MAGLEVRSSKKLFCFWLDVKNFGNFVFILICPIVAILEDKMMQFCFYFEMALPSQCLVLSGRFPNYSLYYSGDLNSELVWYSNGGKQFVHRMVPYSDPHLVTELPFD